MASFRFGLQPLKNNKVLIRATIEDSCPPIYASTKHTFPAAKIKGEYKYWDAKHRRVRQTDDADIINAKLSDWQSRWDDYIKECSHHKTKVDILLFRDSLKNDAVGHTINVNKPAGAPTTLWLLAKEFLKHIKNEDAAEKKKPGTEARTHKLGTIKGYKTCVDNIEAYEKAYGPVPLEAVDKDFYRKYGLFLIKHSNNINNTINRKISRVVTLMNYATDKKRQYTTNNQFDVKYRFKESKAARFALRADEITKLKKYKTTNVSWRMRLDAFLLAFETTLRFSDVIQLKPVHKTDRTIGNKTIPIIDLTQIKTTNKNIIALSDYALKIWNTYAIYPRKRLFPLNYNHNIGDTLKDIFEDAGLNRLCEIVRTQGEKVTKEVVPLHDAISFHMGRKSAITYQLKNLSPALVLENSGIKKMETLMRYWEDEEDQRMIQTLALQNKKPLRGKKK